jgi:hypothetical protein
MRIDLTRDFARPPAEPELATLTPRARTLIERLERDGDGPFLAIARSFGRTSKSFPTAAMLADHVMRDVEVGVEGVEDVFLWILFVLVIDDQTDDEIDPAALGPEGIAPYLRSVMAAARGPLADGADGPTRFLHALTTRLRARPAFAVYERLYLDTLSAMLDAMRAEFDQRDRGAPETLESYLEVAVRSVGIDPLLAVALIATGDASLRERQDRVRALSAMVSVISRLANDIRSYERELAEGKIGALQLAARKLGIPPERMHVADQREVLRVLMASIRLELCDLRDSLRYLDDARGGFSSCLVNTAVAIIRLYERADFHDMPVQA